jgi:hypothetical protein
METANKDLTLDAKTYFLQQGQSINKLNDILDSNILTHYLNKWFSVTIEFLLYALFIITLIGVFIIPDNLSFYFPVNETTQITAQIQNEDFAALIMCFKLICILLSLPLLLFAILLGRNRKKNTLIRKAYEESMKMKESFDLALKSLKL